VMGGQRIVRAEDIEQALGLSQKTSTAPATSKLH
jgi:hypothetical protein